MRQPTAGGRRTGQMSQQLEESFFPSWLIYFVDILPFSPETAAHPVIFENA
jgi:hypothetical protein